MTKSEEELRAEIRKAILLGLANHTNEFLNPGFAPGLTHEQCKEILNRIMEGRLEERITSLIQTHTATVAAEAAREARIDELQMLVGTHNNDPSTDDYSVIRVKRELLNMRLATLNNTQSEKGTENE